MCVRVWGGPDFCQIIQLTRVCRCVCASGAGGSRFLSNNTIDACLHVHVCLWGREGSRFLWHKCCSRYPQKKNKLLAHYECQLDWLWNHSQLRMSTSMTVGSRRTKHTSSTLLLFGVPRNSTHCKETLNAFARNIHNCPGTSTNCCCTKELAAALCGHFWCVTQNENVLAKFGICLKQPRKHLGANITWFSQFTIPNQLILGGGSRILRE